MCWTVTREEMSLLQATFGDDLKISKAYHCFDEDAWNEIDISYCGIFVGSELVPVDSVWDNIKEVWRKRYVS